jgi:hypothetical protein
MTKLRTALFLSAVIIVSAVSIVNASEAVTDDKPTAPVTVSSANSPSLLLIPDTGNFLSNKMMVASVTRGTEGQADVKLIHQSLS